MTMTVGQIQQRAIDDAIIRWREAVGALDLAQREAENLHDASPQLLPDDLFWEALGAFGGMQQLLADLIEAMDEPVSPRAAAARDKEDT